MLETNSELLVELLASELEISKTEPSSLLLFINAPPDVFAVARVMSNLKDALLVLAKVVALSTDAELEVDQLSVWIKISTWAAENEQKLSEVLGPDNIDHEKSQPLHGRIGDWPLYCALYYRHPNDENRAQHVHLTAQFLLVAHAYRAREASEDRDYANSVMETTRLVRLLADIQQKRAFDERQNILTELPSEAVSQLDFAHIVQARADSSDSDHWRILARAMRHAVTNSGGLRRATTEAPASDRKTIINLEDIDEFLDSSSGAITHITRMRSPMLSNKIVSEMIHDGLSPDELLSGTEHLIFTERDEQEKRQRRAFTPQAGAMRTRGLAKAISMRNQSLSMRWGGLSLWETASLHNQLFTLADNESNSANDFHPDVSNLELAALMLSIYWTANPLKSVIDIRLSTKKTRYPKTIGAGKRHFSTLHKQWLLAPLKPKYISSLTDESKAHLVATGPVLVLQIHSEISSRIARWKDAKHKGEAAEETKLFSQTEEIYQEAIQQLLIKLNSQTLARFTLKRIESDFSHHLYHTCRDWVEVSLITGVMHGQSDVAIHYAAPQMEKLYNAYGKTCNQLMNSISEELSWPELPVPILPMEQCVQAKLRFGCRTLLKPDSVRELVQNLKTRYRERLRQVGTKNYLVELHNIFTLYVMLMLHFTTGYRAVKDPLYSFSHIDLKTGLVVISDKDADDWYHSRLAWLPKQVCDQLLMYAEHCRLLSQRLMILNRNLADSILTSESTPFLFLLDEQFQQGTLRPAELKKRLETFFPVPINVNRAYLRNRLRDMGVDGEVVRLFMGHWDMGQEPYSRNSSLSPLEFKRVIEEPITEIFKGDGWSVLRGICRDD
ncbi:hypothetical protein SAMN05216296_0021 [Pseudomonas pohangensis]|uniref:Uncharacterized protein n=1 Tax=Pseudomonas pohangensis TaxID=364197 RepID=A0A1H2DUR7_9PSED|nr:hypothetical protein [Pseudomonas pohangensis]SDT86582.1 hypothetical protein SAMN05216296_0021 [Pseudomonas pohangensis]